MASTMFILVLFAIASTTSGVIEPASKECEPVKFQCLCGSDPDTFVMPLTLERKLMVYNGTGTAKCSETADPNEICRNHDCVLMPEVPSASNNFGGKLGDALVSQFFPTVFQLAPTGEGKGNRFPREVYDPCNVQALQNAEVKCWKWPNWITCETKCIHGHAMQVGKDVVTKASFNCRLTENHWKPTAFQDCQPYVNCRVKLIKPGDLSCKGPSNEPAYCDISCLDYDDVPATPTKRYECINDGYAQMLPPCAILDKESVRTIRKPNA